MCKVCRLWDVLSLALFSYACRPNFHHKHLTPSDPLLSVCEEALISLHTCADRAQILELGLSMNACFSAYICARVHPWHRAGKVWVSVCAHAWVCMHECVGQFRTVPRASNYSASSPFPLLDRFFAFSLVCAAQSTAERNHVYWGVTQSEDRLGFVSAPPPPSPPSASTVHQTRVRLRGG